MDDIKYEIMKENYLRTFRTMKGKLVLKDLEKRFHIHSSTYFPEDGSDGVLFKEGSREVILHILNMMKIK